MTGRAQAAVGVRELALSVLVKACFEDGWLQLGLGEEGVGES